MGREVSKMAKKLSGYRVRFCQLVFCLLVGVFSPTSYSAPESELWPIWAKDNPDSTKQIPHQKWQDIIDRYLDVSAEDQIYRFDYGGISSDDKDKLESYIADLSGIDPRDYNKDEQLAYWINLYNASVVSIVLRVEPENSVRSVSRIWKRKRFKIARQKMSLADIEHGVIRPLSNDPRVNFGFFHGTVGAGNILPVAFTGDNLDALLEENVRSFITQSSRGVDIQGNTLQVSSMFDWYRSDFGGSDDDVKNFIKQYVSSEIASAIDQTTSIAYQYDWELNKP